MNKDVAQIGQDVPVMIFDNRCYLCIKFAKAIGFLAGGGHQIDIVGHYSNRGKDIRDKILDESALEMFWFIDGKKAYGGRAALLPLARSIFFSKRIINSSGSCGNHYNDYDYNGDNGDNCAHDNNGDTGELHCKTPKAVFVRSSSLLTNSRVIDISVNSK